jgi:hypothetical protein
VVDGVLEDVLERLQELLLGLDLLRPESLAEDVVLPAVALVERARVLAVEVAHAVGEVRQGCLDDEVVVVAEEAARVQAPAVAPADAFQDLEEHAAVAIVPEDRRVVVPFRADVVEGAGSEVAVRASHRIERSSGARPATATCVL